MIYDIILIGSGPANLFAAMEIAQNTDQKILILEKARRLNDSRNVSLGWLGASSRSAATLFMEPGFGGEIDDADVFAAFHQRLKEYTDGKVKILKPKLLRRTVKHITDAGIDVFEPATIQMTEDRTIKLGDFLYQSLKRCATVLHKIEINSIVKTNDAFHINTNDGEYVGKRVILGMGRGGPRWLKSITNNLDLEFEQDSFDFGIRLEFPYKSMEECLSKSSHFSFKFGDYKTTAPVVNGTVETEEIGEVRISNGRIINSHKSVNTNIGILKRFQSNNAEEDLYRLVEIVNVLCDGQLLREPVNKLLTSTSVASPVPEFDSLKDGVQKLVDVFPSLQTRCAVYAPEARLNTNRYKLSQSWQSGIEGLYIIGDMSGRTRSFVQAACSGLLAAKHIIERGSK